MNTLQVQFSEMLQRGIIPALEYPIIICRLSLKIFKMALFIVMAFKMTARNKLCVQ
jgi:hypothetical protein